MRIRWHLREPTPAFTKPHTNVDGTAVWRELDYTLSGADRDSQQKQYKPELSFPAIFSYTSECVQATRVT